MSTDQYLAQATELLYLEADCLDAADLESWLQLYTEDGTYWMPVTPDQPDPLDHISLFYDDRTIMEIRKRNLVHPRAASKELPIRCSHLIGNVRVTESTAEALSVTSNFHCVVYSDNQQQLYAGKYLHELRRIDGELRIHHKRVDIINCDANLGAILIYL